MLDTDAGGVVLVSASMNWGWETEGGATITVAGPYCVAAGQTFSPGVVAGQTHAAGAVAGQVRCH